MKKSIWYCLIFLSIQSSAQKLQRPKLVVGIVVDQMRWDFLYRFHDRFVTGGFKRLLQEGFSCENTFIPYTPTYTAAGHASIYTGSVPSLNGMMGNNWYDREQKKVVYCTDDTVQTVGSSSVAGKMSPRKLWSTTITDELRLATNFKSKTIAIALKDRGSILPGGHTSNGAFWFDNATGGWITSSYYMPQLPEWVNQFNNKKLPEQYLQKNWNTLYPLQTYTQSLADSNAYEGNLPGEDQTFPHKTSQLTNNKFDAFRFTPFGDAYTFDMAKAAVENEQLGKRNTTDFLALSFSSPDYIGHTFGPNSIEIEDTYLRFDQQLSSFLTYLDATVGKGAYVIFLTADHGVAHNPMFMADQKFPSGAMNLASFRKQLDDSLEKKFMVKGLLEQYINYQFYLNDDMIVQNGLDKKAIKQYLINFLIRQPGVAQVIDLADLMNTTLQDKQKMTLSNGYNQKLSGDIQLVLRPQWFENNQTGTTHGTWNPYDTHIPLVWFGWHVRHGSLSREVYMTDISPTIAYLLHIQAPSASIGKVIGEVSGDK